MAKTPTAEGHGGPEATQLGSGPQISSSKPPLEVKIPQPVREPLPVPFQTEVRPSVTHQRPALTYLLKELQGRVPQEPTADGNEPSESDISDIVFSAPRPKPRELQAPIRPFDKPEQLRRGCLFITNRTGPLTTQFSGVDEPALRCLDAAEKTKGGLKRMLAKVMEIAHKTQHEATITRAKKQLGSDNEEEPSGREGDSGEASLLPSILECIHHAMVLEKQIRDLDKAQAKEDGDKMSGIGSIVPPGGVDEGHASTSDFETDSDSEFGPDADQLAAAADYDKMEKARRKGGKQDSGKIPSC